MSSAAFWLSPLGSPPQLIETELQIHTYLAFWLSPLGSPFIYLSSLIDHEKSRIPKVGLGLEPIFSIFELVENSRIPKVGLDLESTFSTFFIVFGSRIPKVGLDLGPTFRLFVLELWHQIWDPGWI